MAGGKTYVVHMETTIVKYSTVRIKNAQSIADAVEQARQRLKANDVDWGLAEVGQQFLDVVEEK